MRGGQWSLEQVRTHVAQGLPFVELFNLKIIEATPVRSVVSLTEGSHIERPGGVVAGPVLFGMADVAVYALVLATCGDAAAVTVDMNINFLRRVMPPVFATALPLKHGRRLFVAEINITAADAPAALFVKATTTWALSGRASD